MSCNIDPVHDHEAEDNVSVQGSLLQRIDTKMVKQMPLPLNIFLTINKAEQIVTTLSSDSLFGATSEI